MDEMKLSKDRLEILKRIEEYERLGRFDEDVEDDPEAPELLPENVDYLCEKFFSKVSRKIANFIGDRYFLNLINGKNAVFFINIAVCEEFFHHILVFDACLLFGIGFGDPDLCLSVFIKVQLIQSCLIYKFVGGFGGFIELS